MTVGAKVEVGRSVLWNMARTKGEIAEIMINKDYKQWSITKDIQE